MKTGNIQNVRVRTRVGGLAVSTSSALRVRTPSHNIATGIPQEIEKMVGNFMKTCHKAGDEKHKTSNRVNESDHDMLWWSDLGNLGNWRACIEQRSGCVG
jgi:hypothetical protein